MGSVFLKGVRLLHCSSSVIPVETVWADHGIHAREMLGSRNFSSQTPICALQISLRGWLQLSVLKFWGVSFGLSFYFKTSTVWSPTCHFSLLYSSAHLISLFARACSYKLQRGFLIHSHSVLPVLPWFWSVHGATLARRSRLRHVGWLEIEKHLEIRKLQKIGSWGKVRGRQRGASSMQCCWGVPAAQDAGSECRWSSSRLQHGAGSHVRASQCTHS